MVRTLAGRWKSNILTVSPQTEWFLHSFLQTLFSEIVFGFKSLYNYVTKHFSVLKTNFPTYIHFIISSSQACQVTQQNLKTAWKVLAVPGVSPVRWVSLVSLGSQVCRDFVKLETAAFMHQWHGKSKVWWKDPWVQSSEHLHEQRDVTEDLRDTWWKPCGSCRWHSSRP